MSRPGVSIRPIASKDAEAVQRLVADPRILRETLLPEPYPAGGAARFIERMERERAAGLSHVFAVMVAEAVAGVVGVHRRGGGWAEVGYWIGVPFWGRGVATSAVRRLTRFALEDLGYARLAAMPLARNVASRRVLEKNGYLHESTIPNPFDKWGHEVEVCVYTLNVEGGRIIDV